MRVVAAREGFGGFRAAPCPPHHHFHRHWRMEALVTSCVGDSASLSCVLANLLLLPILLLPAPPRPSSSPFPTLVEHRSTQSSPTVRPRPLPVRRERKLTSFPVLSPPSPLSPSLPLAGKGDSARGCCTLSGCRACCTCGFDEDDERFLRENGGGRTATMAAEGGGDGTKRSADYGRMEMRPPGTA